MQGELTKRYRRKTRFVICITCWIAMPILLFAL